MLRLLFPIALLLTGCSTTRVVSHDFNTVKQYFEKRYLMDFSKNKEKLDFPIGSINRIEVTEYVDGKILELKLNSVPGWHPYQKLISVEELNDTQSTVRIRYTSRKIPPVYTRDEEREIRWLDEFEDQIVHY